MILRQSPRVVDGGHLTTSGSLYRSSSQHYMGREGKGEQRRKCGDTLSHHSYTHFLFYSTDFLFKIQRTREGRQLQIWIHRGSIFFGCDEILSRSQIYGINGFQSLGKYNHNRKGELEDPQFQDNIQVTKLTYRPPDLITLFRSQSTKISCMSSTKWNGIQILAKGFVLLACIPVIHFIIPSPPHYILFIRCLKLLGGVQ